MHGFKYNVTLEESELEDVFKLLNERKIDISSTGGVITESNIDYIDFLITTYRFA